MITKFYRIEVRLIEYDYNDELGSESVNKVGQIYTFTGSAEKDKSKAMQTIGIITKVIK